MEPMYDCIAGSGLTMSELRSIVLAIELATRKRDDLAKAAARVEQTLQFAQGQMRQLEGYAAETDARWVHSGSEGRSAELMRHHFQFMERLQHAIGLQSGVMAQTGQQLATAKQMLLQAEYRLAGLNQVLKKRQSQALLGERRREQRQTDEFAAMLHARNTRSSKIGELP